MEKETKNQKQEPKQKGRRKKSHALDFQIEHRREKFSFGCQNLMIIPRIFNRFQGYVDTLDINKHSFDAEHPIWELAISFVLTYIKYNQLTLKKPYVRVSSELLNHLFSKKSYIVLKFLRECGYIKIIKGYTKQGRKCNGYALTEKYCDKEKFVKFRYSKKLVETKNYKSYVKKIQSGLCIVEDQNISKIVNDDKFDHCIRRKVKNDHTKLKERISEPHKNLRLDSASRVHTVFTNMPKRLRRKMQYNGEKLVEIDVRSCQPLLMAALYGKNKKTKSGKTLYFEKESLTPAEQEEKDRFVSLCQSKLGFYGSLQITKASFGFCLFGKLTGSAWHNNIMVIKLKQMNFPILVKRLEALRNRLVLKDNNEVSHSRVALFFQRWESFLMIDNSLQKMDYGAIPVHDAVIVKKENAIKAAELITNNFCRYLGIENMSYGAVNYLKGNKRLHLKASIDAINTWLCKIGLPLRRIPNYHFEPKNISRPHSPCGII